MGFWEFFHITPVARVLVFLLAVILSSSIAVGVFAYWADKAGKDVEVDWPLLKISTPDPPSVKACRELRLSYQSIQQHMAERMGHMSNLAASKEPGINASNQRFTEARSVRRRMLWDS